MRFVMQIQREVHGVLLLEKLSDFGENLVIEFECLLNRRILVEVTAKWDKGPGDRRQFSASRSSSNGFRSALVTIRK